jgi:hypothetical protein
MVCALSMEYVMNDNTRVKIQDLAQEKQDLTPKEAAGAQGGFGPVDGLTGPIVQPLHYGPVDGLGPVDGRK